MFNPSELEGIPLPLELHFSELESRIMSDIIRRIKINSEITRSADWQIQRLSELGKSNDEIKSYIQDTLKLSDEEIDNLYTGVIETGYARDKALYEAVGKPFIPFAENAGLQQLITATALQTKTELKNITQSLGFAKKVDGKIVFEPIAEFYQKTLDSAMLDITSGAFDYNSVIKRTVFEMTNSGLRTVDYATGWSNRVPVASRRAVMTGVNQVTSKINDDNAIQLETEYFEVTWHGTARPSHQEWQGKVFTKQQLVEICGLGSVTGLCGANCYHSYFPFIPGVSERTYTDEELAELNANENIKREYAGKEYNAYEATQHQRKMETLMRKQRQDIKLLQEGGANEDEITFARCRYRSTMAQYSEFSSKMELPQQRERITIDGLGDVGVGRYKKSKIAEKTTNKFTHITEKAIEKVPEIKVNEYTDIECKYIHQQHKELLKTAMEANDSKEVAFIFDKDFKQKSISFGEDDVLEFKSKTATDMLAYGKDLFIMHNHPRNGSFSMHDLNFFFSNDRIKSLSIVKNNGAIEILTKSQEFNLKILSTEKERIKKKVIDKRTDAEYNKLVKILLSKTKSGLVWEVH